MKPRTEARHEPRLLPDAAPPLVAPSVSFPSSPPPRMLDVHTAYVPPPPSLPPDTFSSTEFAPASDTFHAGFAALSNVPSDVPTSPMRSANPGPEHHSPTDPMDLSRAQVDATQTPDGAPAGEEEVEEPAPLSPPEEALEVEAPAGHAASETLHGPSPDQVLETILDALSATESRDELMQALVEGASQIAVRVAVFVFKKDGYHGWVCNPEFGERAAFRAVTIPHTVPNILATATAAGFYLGPVPSTPGHTSLLAVMGRAGPEVAVHVARVSGKPAILLLAEGLGDTMRDTRAFGEIMRVAGLALARILALR
jgi:hypothetical protein